MRLLIKKRLNLKYSLVWMLSAFLMLIISLFPGIVVCVGALIDIATPVNTIFLFAGMFSILIILTLTVIVSHMNSRIYKLTQIIALLEKRVRELEKI
jgi:hypothetical protein